MKIKKLSLVVLSSVFFVMFANGATAAVANYTSVFLEPQAGEAPILDLIKEAKQNVEITIYELDDKNIQAALNNAANHGINVQIIYSNRTGSYENTEVAFCTSNPRISCRRASGSESSGYDVPYGFFLTHEKSLLIDNSIAVIMSLNMVKNSKYDYFSKTRDFGVITNNPSDVNSLSSQFTTDWANAANNTSNFPSVDPNSRLFFSPSRIEEPHDSYNALSSLINQATKNIEIYAENFSDKKMINLLNSKAKAGVKIRIIAAENKAQGLLDPSIQIIQPFESYPLYFHAKSIIVDDKVATVMSVNYSDYSINQNREAGITLEDPKNVSIMEDTFNKDWNDLALKLSLSKR